MDKLSIEQEFEVAKIAATIPYLSRKDLEKHLVDLLRTMMLKENAYSQFLLESAGIVTPIYEDRKQ